MAFSLHPQLEADTAPLADLPLCRVLLMDDATYPWLILVPALDGLRDLHDLPAGEDARLMTEIRQASLALAALHSPDKINVAALGNQVPQLHIHVIARFASDPGWPGPVWGKAPRQPYESDACHAAIAALRQALADAA
jgi:diadenosine tetraphosphate (Ap4A) HIT family hydrolase